jgi:hypothetical protein
MNQSRRWPGRHRNGYRPQAVLVRGWVAGGRFVGGRKRFCSRAVEQALSRAAYTASLPAITLARQECPGRKNGGINGGTTDRAGAVPHRAAGPGEVPPVGGPREP